MTVGQRLLGLRRWAGSAPVAVALLVAANLLPLVGVAVFGWDVLSILIIYWLENGVVGVLNVARMALAAGPAGTSGIRVSGSASKVALIPFFCIHYGIFWVVHGVFVFALPMFAGVGGFGGSGFGAPAPAAPDGGVIVVGALALAASHGASFVVNYVGRGEYRTASVGQLFVAPYGRVVVLHLTVLLGGFAALAAGGPVALVALLVAFKTGLDLLLHLREHAAAARRVQAAPG